MRNRNGGTATVLKIGPADHGRPITEEELRTGEREGEYKYEIIEGKLYVSYEADLSANLLDDWLFSKVKSYSRRHPEVINYVTNKARVFVPGLLGLTIPEPDLTAYLDLRIRFPIGRVRWQDVIPLLVGEVVGRDAQKDLVRNVRLYEAVPTIREYWILDPREDADRPNMIVYRRRGTHWQRPIELAYREVYRTKLLPRFRLVIDPQS